MQFVSRNRLQIGCIYYFIIVAILFPAKSWAAPDYFLKTISLTGANYQFGQKSDLTRFADLVALSNSGDAVGYNLRYGTSSASLGRDAWQYSAGTTSVIGLTGAGYEFSVPAGAVRFSDVYGLNRSAQAFGISARYNNAGDDRGQDTWLRSGGITTSIGLAGTGYEYSPSGGNYRYSYGQSINAAGQVLGASNRYHGSGSTLGTDAWLRDGGTTSAISLTGAPYEYSKPAGTYRSSMPDFLNDAGQVVGHNTRYTSAGTETGSDVWLYAGGAPMVVGLTGAGYEYTSSGSTYRTNVAKALNSAGQVAGEANRYSGGGAALGVDAWLRIGSKNVSIGLSGAGYEYSGAPGVTRVSAFTQLNNAGQAIGTTNRYLTDGTAVGVDGWLSNGETTSLVGLTGTGYEARVQGGNRRSTSLFELNSRGDVIGISVRYNTGGTTPGSQPWFRSTTGATTPIGLTGPGFEYSTPPGAHRESQLIKLNESGQVLGIQKRFDSTGTDLGQSGWFYDSATNTTAELTFSLRSDNYAYTNPELLTDSGAVLGSYTLFDGSKNTADHAFVWTQSDGFADLGTLVAGGLSAAQWQSLANVVAAVGTLPAGYPRYISGVGLPSDQAMGQSVYMMIPEPSSIALPAIIASVWLLKRRPLPAAGW